VETYLVPLPRHLSVESNDHAREAKLNLKSITHKKQIGQLFQAFLEYFCVSYENKYFFFKLSFFKEDGRILHFERTTRHGTSSSRKRSSTNVSAKL